MSLLAKYLWSRIFENEETTSHLSDDEKSELTQYNNQQEKSLHYKLKNQAEDLLKPFSPEKDEDGKYKGDSEYAKAMNDYNEKAEAFTKISKEIDDIEKRKFIALAEKLKEKGIHLDVNLDLNTLKNNREAWNKLKAEVNKQKKDNKELFDKTSKEFDDLKNAKIDKKNKLKLEQDKAADKKNIWEDLKKKMQARADKIKAIAEKIKANEDKIKTAREKMERARAKIEALEQQQAQREKSEKETMNALSSGLKSLLDSTKESYEEEIKAKQAEIDEKKKQAELDIKAEADKEERKKIENAINKEVKAIEDKQKEIENFEKELENSNKELSNEIALNKDLKQAAKTIEDKAKARKDFESKAAMYNDGDEDPRKISKNTLDNLNDAQKEYIESLRAILIAEFPDQNIDDNTSLERLIEIADSKKSKIAKNIIKNINNNKKSIEAAETEYGKACYEAREFGIDVTEEQKAAATKYEENFSISKFLESKQDKTTKVETDDSGNETTKYTPIQVTVDGEQIQICYIDGEWIKMNKNQDKKYEPTEETIEVDKITDWQGKLKVDIPAELTQSEKDAYKSLTGKDIDNYPQNINEPYGEGSKIAKSQVNVEDKKGKVTEVVKNYNDSVDPKKQIKIPSGFENDTKQENDLEDPSDLDSFDKLKSFFDSELTEKEKKNIKEKLGKSEDDELTEEDKDKLKQELQNWYSKSTEETEDDGSEDGEDDDDSEYVEKTNKEDDNEDDESKDENDENGKPKPPKRKLKRKTKTIRLKGGGTRKSRSIIGYTDDGIIKDDKGKATIFSKEDLRKNKEAWKRYKKRMATWKEEHPNESLSAFLQNNINAINKNKNKKMKLSEYLYESLNDDARELFIKVISEEWDEKLYNKLSRKVGVFAPNNQQLFSFMKGLFNLVEKRKVDPFLNLNWIDTSKITSMYMMFKGKHVRFNMTKWNTSNVTNFTECFADAFVLRNTIEGWDMSSADALPYMFADATVNCDLSKWVIDKTKYPRYINIFKNCKIDKKHYPMMKDVDGTIQQVNEYFGLE